MGFDFDVSVLVYGGDIDGLLVSGCEREVADDRCDISGNCFEICRWVGGGKVIHIVFGCGIVEAVCEASGYQWVELSSKLLICI